MNDSSHAPIRASGAPGLNQRLLLCLTAVSRASSCLIAVVGLAILLGWYFDIELLRAGLPGRTPRLLTMDKASLVRFAIASRSACHQCHDGSAPPCAAQS